MQMFSTPSCKGSHAPATASTLIHDQRTVVKGTRCGPCTRQHTGARTHCIVLRSPSAQQRYMHTCACAAAMADAEASRADDSGAAHQDARQADGGAAAPPPDAAQTADWIEVGLIRSVHGLRGEVKVEPLTDSPADRLGAAGVRWLQQPEAPGRRRQRLPPPTEVSIEAGRSIVSKGREVWLVKLAGTDSPEEADTLRGCKLLIRPTDRPPLTDEDEFYAQVCRIFDVLGRRSTASPRLAKTFCEEDLIGMAVVQHGSEAAIGKVVDIYDGTGTHDTLRILLGAEDPEDACTVLVPFHRSIVPQVDAAARRLTIDPPAGLFDTAVPARRRHKNPRNKLPKL